MSPPGGSCREPSPKGVYVLLLQSAGGGLSIGSLGECRFSRGWYGYIGSARGPGGFARVRRHYRLYLDRDRPPSWHIDHLLLDSRFRLRYLVCGITEQDQECQLAELLIPPGLPGFGCSDCRCLSHLFYRKHDPKEDVMRAFSELAILPVIKTINNHG
ncbi:MAG: DUF123 domain-containing protein [Methanomicrobiales archaeon]|nr:DUF123 domain-containing protein [Methanomicrobiales archaeon]